MPKLEQKITIKDCSECFKESGGFCKAVVFKTECKLGIPPETEKLNKCYHFPTYKTVNSDNEMRITRIICAECGKILKETIERGNFRGLT
jgi:hypothetical protein